MRQLDWMPVGDPMHGPRIHVRAGLAGIEGYQQHDEEHHVASQGTKDKCAGAVQQFSWAAPRLSPVVVAATAAAARRPAVNGWLAPGSGRFPFDFGGNGRK